jgi:serine/threonine protein kinase
MAMVPEDWKRLEDLYHQALGLGEEQRARFLDEACAGDSVLRRNLESLLAQDTHSTNSLLGAPDPATVPKFQPGRDSTPGALTGKTVSHYRVFEKLGSGGMGVVYRAEDTKLDRDVALKFLPEALSEHRDAISRLRREARAASALNHPHICTIHDIDEHEGRPFIVIELLKGQTLKSRIAGKALPIEQLVEFALQIADALEAAHARGIIHRDIKPANLFITERGQIKVLDFGLAKLTPSGAEAGASKQDSGADLMRTLTDHVTLTGAGTALGTIAYMSPEQARGEDLDTRTDLFSFGAVLYEMATGRIAFDGRSPAIVFKDVLYTAPMPPRTLNPALPPRIEEIILKAMEKDRDVRYQTASEMRADLKRWKRDSDLPGATISVHLGSRQVASARQDAGPSKSRLSRAWPLAAAVVALGFALTIGYRFGWVGADSQSPSATLIARQITFNSTEQPVFFSAISPDGKFLAYGDSTGIHLRQLDTGETHSLPVPDGFCFH